MWYTQHKPQSPHAKWLDARAQKAQLPFLAKIAKHCSHAITLQTRFKTFNRGSQDLLDDYEITRHSLHQLRMQSNRALTGNGWRRNARYTPIFVPAIEGLLNTYDRNKSLHIHLAVGNLPARFTDADLLAIYRDCWLSTRCAKDDVVLVPMWEGQECGWLGYMTKEEEKDEVNSVDYHNTQIPEHIVAQL